MTRSIVNDAKIDAGDGDNRLSIHDNIEVRGLRFDAGAGNDEIEIRNNVGIKRSYAFIYKSTAMIA